MDPTRMRMSERLVKSSERVHDLGEVFTPQGTVQDMLNLLPDVIWSPHPSPTFLEPACGDGNFLVAIFQRKLDRVRRDFGHGRLPAGPDVEAAQFHALQALSSVYGVDISPENVVGGTKGHEIGARSRMVKVLVDWCAEFLNLDLNPNDLVRQSAIWIVNHNVIVGNMLPFEQDGKPTSRSRIPIIEYAWDPLVRSVTLATTDLGDLIEAEVSRSIESADDADGDELSFGFTAESKIFWKGEALQIPEAPEPPRSRRNSRKSNR